MTGQEPGRPRRTEAVVHRSGPELSHLVLPGWMHGQITVPIPTDELLSATDLGRDELPWTELTVTANLAAATDTDVDPRDAQLPAWRCLQAA
ncbi:hypothetical protein [Streptomyces sp. NPDC047453]|uniref:hypothetical protein n=1 Tax=Streptomyces sp. NPDC047453 TaxID=3154812 RepID=UPI003401529D